jgi:hypothetical protein
MKQIVRWRAWALGLLCVIAFLLRIYGLNWDQGNTIHPDERQILFTVMKLSWPQSLGNFFSTQSPLNPHFFAYGTFPMYLLALLAYVVHIPLSNPASIVTLSYMGRCLSAIFDSGTVFLTALLALKLASKKSVVHSSMMALFAAALVAVTPLQLELSHYFAVDTILLFLVLLTLLGCVALIDTKYISLWSMLIGVGYGLALGTKLSAAPLIVPICVALCLYWWQRRDWVQTLTGLCIVALVTIVVFVIVEPYAFIDTSEFMQQATEQGNIARGVVDMPFIRQFAGTIPYVYEVQNLVLWGLGLSLGVVACIALCGCVVRLWWRCFDGWLVLLSWVIVYGVLMCNLYVKYMRYLLPIYPMLTLMAVALLTASISALSGRLGRFQQSIPFLAWLRWSAIVLVVAGTLFQGLALLSVYSVPNTRIQASLWLYRHVLLGGLLTYEQWDDQLPYTIDNYSSNQFRQYTYQDDNNTVRTGLDLYADDTQAKAKRLADALSQVDAIVMATDRLDKSIPRSPSRYPLTIRYYQLLFSGQLGFRLAATFENHPHLCGITLDDSNADESYSVFDHPTARIFLRTSTYTSKQLYDKLMAGIHLPA